MNYTAKQIENAKRAYNAMMKFETISDYDVETIGMNEAETRVEYHNNIVREILAGNTELEKEWKVFFCNEEVKKDLKVAASKKVKDDNKAATSDVLSSIKEMKKLGAFGKWLNTSGNPYRKQHFNKYYTVEAVNAFLETL